jgi:hypothetical protein
MIKYITFKNTIMAGLAFFIDSTFDTHLDVSPTPSGDIKVTGISIIGEASIDGVSGTYSVSYSPASTTQKGVNWSIVSGANYASINSSGVLTVKESASGSLVKIKAASSYNPLIYAEKDVTVTYNDSGASTVISEFCRRVLADGGILLKGSAGATQEEYDRHTALLGIEPKLDFLGYKETGGVISKLYSIDSKYDCDSLTGIVLNDGIITTTEAAGKILYNKNFNNGDIRTEMTHLYYEGPLDTYSTTESVFVANILKSSYSGRYDVQSANIFYMGGLINVQYAGSIKAGDGFPATSPTKIKVEVDGNASGEEYAPGYVKSISINDVDKLSTRVQMADFWSNDTKDVSYIKTYQGFQLCIAG